jgi:hypothetical protein
MRFYPRSEQGAFCIGRGWGCWLLLPLWLPPDFGGVAREQVDRAASTTGARRLISRSSRSSGLL